MLFILFVTVTFSYMDRVLVGLLAPLIKGDLNLSDTAFGLLSGTTFAVAFCCASIPVGWMADRYSRKWVIASGIGLWSAATVGFGLGGRFLQLITGRALVGVGETGAAGPSYAMLSAYFPDGQRARAMAIMGFGQCFGMVAAAALAGVVAGPLGWRAAFLAAGGAGLVVMLVVMFTIREPARRPTDATHPAAINLLNSILTMFRKPAFLMVISGAALGSMASQPQAYWLPSYFTRSFDIPIGDVSLRFGIINFAAGLTGVWFSGYITDRLAVRSPSAYLVVPACLAILAALSLMGMLVTSSPMVAFACYAATAMLSYGLFAPIMTATQFLAPPGMRATAAAICGTASTAIGVGIGVPIVGAISDNFAPALGSEALRAALLATLPGLYILAAGAWLTGGLLIKRRATVVNSDPVPQRT